MDEDLPHNTHALISYNHDAPQEEGCGEYEEVIAEHSDDVIDDNKNEKEALMLVDDYLTEFDDVPREVRFQFLERFTFCALLVQIAKQPCLSDPVRIFKIKFKFQWGLKIKSPNEDGDSAPELQCFCQWL